ncbi:MAG: 4Fe-4S double cluster binding domain-containing protein [Candidatus Omnitrophica bacterium]|nr:4Fe-4S double cluster binding domain-containing protein [Candidatus Omnitrophota bacterium]
MNDYDNLKEFCAALGADLFGVANIGVIKKDFLLCADILKKLDKAVCLGVRLSAGVLEDIADSPTRLYFHHYRTVNAFLDQTALKLSNYIEDKGYYAIAVPASQIVDWDKQSAHLSHKKLGALAGLGWIGRNNLLVNKKLGSQFRLVSVLTDMPLKIDQPVAFACGKCGLCVDACPAQAIKDKPEDFEHIKCFEQLKEFQKKRLVDQYICGVCVKVCVGARGAEKL